MLGKLARTVFGSANDRFVKRQFKIVQQINALEPEIEKLNNDELKGKTDEFRRRLKEGETLDDILPEAFAVVREAAKRTLGQRHYDVQLIGGIVLHKGMIAEMKTGEGKTLVATLAAYLNAIEGKGVHIVTVNDYLAKSFICVLDCFDEFFATAHLLFRICCTLAALFLFFRKLHKIFLSSKYPLFNLEILSRKLCIFRLSFCHAVRIGVC